MCDGRRPNRTGGQQAGGAWPGAPLRCIYTARNGLFLRGEAPHIPSYKQPVQSRVHPHRAGGLHSFNPASYAECTHRANYGVDAFLS